MSEEEISTSEKRRTRCAVAATVALGIGCFAISRLHVSPATGYLIKSGFGIPKHKVLKSCVRWPFQYVHRISHEPVSIETLVETITSNSVEAKLPVKLLVAVENTDEARSAYACTVSSLTDEQRRSQLEEATQLETRALTGQTDVKHLRGDDDNAYAEHLRVGVNKRIAVWGYHVQVAGIGNITDAAGVYFNEAKGVVMADVKQTTRSAVAKATYDADRAVAEHSTAQRIAVADADRKATLAENTAAEAKADSTKSLAVKLATLKQQTQVAQVQADAAIEKERNEKEKEVQEAFVKAETQRILASQLPAAEAKAAAWVRENEGLALAKVKEADGIAASAIKTAEGRRDASIIEAEGKSKARISTLR